MDDLLHEFLTETNENIGHVDSELVNLEKNPNDTKLLQEIFRVVHTIKGTCGFLGLPRLEAISHAGENILGKFRDGELPVNQEAVTLIFESIDCIKSLLLVLEETESEPPGDDNALIARINAFAEGGGASAAPAVEPEPGPEPEPEPEPEPMEPVAEEPAAEDPAGTLETAEEMADAMAAAEQAAELMERAGAETSIGNQSIRVGVDLLEHLMTMVSELVLTRNQLLQMVRGNTDSEFSAPLQRLSHVTTELQEGVMKTRMQPIGNAWAKLPRIVRDLAVDLGKKIDLRMIGADTELDRQVLELIKDPLTHMVRNSADHGVETPDERKAAGKPPVGELVLNAYHEGGHIIIEVKDDGRGIHLEKVRQRAIQSGIVSTAEMEAMSDQQVLQLIFRPGFSTAVAVTNVSGRGVGMDVVKTNVEKIGGTIELNSFPGKGTSFVIKIPLTLAIVSALIVECAGERFAIPQISVVELVRASTNSGHTIEVINEAPVLRLRDRLLPLVSLSRELRLGGDDQQPVLSDGEMFIVVSQVGTNSFGLIVDKVFDTEEIVVKPVAPVLRDVGAFSGNTILGDGSIVMILDLNGLAASATQAGISSDAQLESVSARETQGEETIPMLVFRAGTDSPKAVPLALVARLEEIDRAGVEFSDGQPVVQYRGALMPLVTVDPSQVIEGTDKTPVVVFSDRERSMGLVVDEIVDIIDQQLEIELAASRPGIAGSAVLAGKTTDIIDAGYFLTQAFKDWFTQADEGDRFGGGQKRLLLVDDSAFFRHLLTPLLSAAGYDVVMAEDGDQALRLLEEDADFDVIVSDIEMPGTNGFDFAKACRSDERLKDTPILALTSYTTPADLARGREAGFTDYVGKFDREALLAALSLSLSYAGDAA